MKVLIAAADAIPGPGFLVLTRNGDLMRWCLSEGLRITQTMTLMTIGLYNQSEGAWLPFRIVLIALFGSSIGNRLERRQHLAH